MSDRCYLDHNATTPLRPEAQSALVSALALGGNPSSVHGEGRQARRVIEDAREAVADLIGAAASGIIFTGGGTEANALAIAGFGGVNFADRPATNSRPLITSSVEHDAVLANLPDDAVRLPVDANGRVVLDDLGKLLARLGRPALVSVMLANNETGVCQPLAEIAEIAHQHGALLHSDAVQAAGKIPVDMAGLGVDLMSLSAHKLGGPQGVGALAVRPGLTVKPLYRGGGQERRLRPGTENVAGIAGFGAAARAAQAGLADMGSLAGLRDQLERGLKARSPDIVFYGQSVARLPNTSCFSQAGLRAETLLMRLDLAGIAVSSGSACSSGKVTPSHVLTAMGVPEEQAAAALRLSLGWTSTADDIARFLATWQDLFGG